MMTSKGFAVITFAFFLLVCMQDFALAEAPSAKEKKLRQAVYELEELRKENPKDDHIKEELAKAYNNYGSELVKQNKIEEGKVYLERALELTPDNRYVLRNLALAYSMVGDEALRQKKRINEARTAYKMAVLYGEEVKHMKRNIGVALYNEAASYVKEKDYDMASSLLEDSIKYYPENEYALELLGDIAYYHQELDEASDYWKKAYLLSRESRINDKLDKLRKEEPVESKLKSYPSERFVIRYVGDRTDIQGYDIRTLLRAAYRAISQDFGYYFKHKIPVLLYTQADYKTVAETPHWSAGLYDGKVRIPAYQKTFSEEDLEKTIWHEMTHAFVFELSKGKAPLWLNEGLAQHEENKVSPINLGFFNAAVKEKSLFSFDELFEDPTEFEDVTSVYLFYQQSFMITEFLIKRYRMYKIKELLEELGNGTPFDGALDKVLRISPAALEIRWLASLKNYEKKNKA